MSDLEKLLEDVAREYWKQASIPLLPHQETVLGIMRRRLLPLLEAGQAMRENFWKELDDTSPDIPGQWDAALEKAKEK